MSNVNKTEESKATEQEDVSNESKNTICKTKMASEFKSDTSCDVNNEHMNRANVEAGEDSKRGEAFGFNNCAVENGSVKELSIVQVDEVIIEDDNEIEDNPVPIDRGWAWMVLIAAFIEMVLLIGILKCAGIFFIQFQKRFNSSSSMTSLLSTVQNAVYSVSALCVMTMATKLFSNRALMMFGTLIMCISYIITSRAEDIRILLFSYGVLQGIGGAFMQPIAMTSLSSYFDKRRGFANSLALTGASLGGLVFAPLVTVLFTKYGYSGCFLILAALLLNGLISGALLRPHSFYTKSRCNTNRKINGADKFKDDFEKETLLLEPEANGHVPVTNGSKVAAHYLLTRQHSKLSGGQINNSSKTKSDNNSNTASAKVANEYMGNTITPPGSPDLRNLRRRRQRTTTESSITRAFDTLSHSLSVKHASAEYIAGSIMDLPGLVAQSVGSRIDYVNEKGDKAPTKFKTVLNFFISSFDFKLFTNPIFLTFELAAMLLCSGNALTSIYIVPHAYEMGFTPESVATLVTIYSSVDLCSRIAIAFISDRGWMRRSTLIGLSSALVAIASHLLRFYSNYGLLIFYAVIIGLFTGVYFSLFAVVIVDYMTIVKLPGVLGFTTLFHGGGIAVNFYLVGHLRDTTGSYLIPFHMIGTMSFIGAILMLLLPTVERIHNSRMQRKEDA